MRGSLRADLGSATLFLLGVCSVGLLLSLVFLRVQIASVAGSAAASAAETAAIAAADALSGFRTGYPCDVAKRISQLNMVSMAECRIVGFDVYIRVRSKSLGMVHFASARAGQP